MVGLLKFEQKHLENTFKWMQDENLKKNFLFRKTLTPAEHLLWFENYLKDKSQQIFGITFNTIHVGNVGLKNIDKINNNAETWIYIGDASMKGKGIAVDVYKNLLSDLSQEFHKIYAQIAEFNTSSIKMYQKAGFILEGTLKDQLYWEEKYYNLLRFAYYL